MSEQMHVLEYRYDVEGHATPFHVFVPLPVAIMESFPYREATDAIAEKAVRKAAGDAAWSLQGVHMLSDDAAQAFLAQQGVA